MEVEHYRCRQRERVSTRRCGPQPVRVRLDRRGLASGRALGGDQRLADLGERPALFLSSTQPVALPVGSALHSDLLAELAEGRLGFGAGQTVRMLLGMNEAEAALDLAAAVAPLGNPRVAVRPAVLAASTRSRLLRILPPPLYHSLYNFSRKSRQLRATHKSRFCSANAGKSRPPEEPLAPMWSPGGRGFESHRSPSRRP